MFKHSPQTKKNTGGLYATVDDLIFQQRYLPYILQRRNLITSNRAGDVKSAFKGRGMELEEVRSYTFGDDIRDIDWRITARKAEPFTKIYNEEKDRTITVFLDLSATMVFGTKRELKTVTAAKTAAVLGWMAIRNKDRFGIMIYDGINTTYFKPQNNLKSLMTVFNAVSKATERVLTQNRFGNIEDVIKKIELRQKGQGIIFILSDFRSINNNNFEKIAALGKHNKVYCLNVFDALEEIVPPDGEYEAQYGLQKVVFDTSSIKFKNEYRKYFAQNRENLKNNCRKFTCQYAEIRTDIPIFKQLSII
jgi:uncharacterized protein (DUF58 family)